MTQYSNTHPYWPNRFEQDLLREIARVARMKHQLLTEEQELPKLRTQWFPSRVQVRNQRFQQEVARLHQESRQHRAAALAGNMLYVLIGKGQPRNTGYQEDLFFLRSTEHLRQQMLKQDECDQSWIAHREQEVAEKRVRLDADTSWLQNEYQRHLQFAQMQEQRDWLLTLSQWYPTILSTPASMHQAQTSTHP